jgi:hypothetical protein
MNHPACSPGDVESRSIGEGPAVALCVFQIIGGVVAGVLVIALAAVMSLPH